MVNKCTGGHEIHDFQPRYSEGTQMVPVFKDMGVPGIQQMEYVDGKHKTYIYDICTRCGITVKPNEYTNVSGKEG